MITVVNTTLRDGMSSVGHGLTTGDVAAVAAGLNGAGASVIETGHGIGLEVSSLQYGAAAASEPAYVSAAAGVGKSAAIAVLCVPGISTRSEPNAARAAGASAVRVATHCIEADYAEQFTCNTSLHAGRSVTVPTSTSIMACLNCGIPTQSAWPTLGDDIDSALTVSDDRVATAVHDLATRCIDAGPCRTATLAGARAHEPLPPESTVLLLSAEGRAAKPSRREGW